MTETTPRTKKTRKLVAAGFLALALGTSALTALPWTDGNAQTAAPNAAVVLPRQAGPQGFGDLAARVAPAVVRVTVTGRAEAQPAAQMDIPDELRGTPFEQYFRQFQQRGGRGPQQGEMGPRGQRPGGPVRMGQGSGFIIDAGGYIVTNNHVVGDAATVKVELTDGRELPARVVGTDPQTDMALLKVEAGAPLPTVTWGDSNALRVGDWVVAMGNPFGLGGSVTAGIVSARGRQIGAGPYDDFIQTDAPINPGNSGGPLFNGAGEVVGINTAIYAPNGGNVGIGFAVPERLARHVIEQLQRDGTVARGWLGVSLQPLDAEMAGALRLPGTRGVLVAGVEARSPAESAGIRAGDVVVGLDGKEIAGPRDLAMAVAELAPNSRATLAVLRDGNRVEQTVTLGTREDTQRQARREDGRPGAVRPGALGLQLAPRGSLGGNAGGGGGNKGGNAGGGGNGGEGVEVAGVEPGSIAATRGIQVGDVILRAGDRDVRSPRDVTEAVAAARAAGRPAIALQVTREGGGRAFVALPLNNQG